MTNNFLIDDIVFSFSKMANINHSSSDKNRRLFTCRYIKNVSKWKASVGVTIPCHFHGELVGSAI